MVGLLVLMRNLFIFCQDVVVQRRGRLCIPDGTLH